MQLAYQETGKYEIRISLHLQVRERQQVFDLFRIASKQARSCPGTQAAASEQWQTGKNSQPGMCQGSPSWQNTSWSVECGGAAVLK